MKLQALCIRCGAAKNAPWKTCAQCQYSPLGDDDALMKSVFLSLHRCPDGKSMEEYQCELAEWSGRIARGEPIIIPPAERDRLLLEMQEVRAVQTIAPWLAVSRLFLPAAILLLALLAVFLVLKSSM